MNFKPVHNTTPEDILFVTHLDIVYMRKINFEIRKKFLFLLR